MRQPQFPFSHLSGLAPYFINMLLIPQAGSFGVSHWGWLAHFTLSLNQLHQQMLSGIFSGVDIMRAHLTLASMSKALVLDWMPMRLGQSWMGPQSSAKTQALWQDQPQGMPQGLGNMWLPIQPEQAPAQSTPSPLSSDLTI
jgi:hypothetical protein